MKQLPPSLPHDESAEKGVLASLLLAPVQVAAICQHSGVSAESFYIPAFGKIFTMICELLASGKPVDFITLASSLRDIGDLEAVGGGPALNDLFIYLPTAASVGHYIEIVTTHHLSRKAILMASRIPADIAETSDPLAVLNGVQAEILRLVTRRNSARKSTKDLIREICAEVVSGRQDVGLMPTGIEAIDSELRLSRSDYMVLPGPTSSGKSALCAQFAIAYAKQGMRVLYVPLEMSARQVIKRAISAESGHSAESVRNMVMNRRDLRGISRDDKEVDAAMQSFSDSAFALANLDITVIDDVFDLDAILSTARAHASTKPLDVLCVDYPALMQMKGNYERRQLALAHASRSFKQFASEINGLVITPSQVNKDGCTREAADFENDANAIVRVDFHEDDETCRVVKIAKQRDGARGQELRLSWRGHTTSFISYQSQP